MRFSNSTFSTELQGPSSTSCQFVNSDPHDDKTMDIYLASHGKTLNDSEFSAEEGFVQVENPSASASPSSFPCTSVFATASGPYQSLISGFSSINDYLWRAPTLGLRLTKSPAPATNHNTQPIIQLAEENREIKKAGHIPMSVLEIGKFRVVSKHEGNLVAKCYYTRRKLMWEILNGNLKSKIEFNWEDILSLGAKIEPNRPGILMIELKELPSFYHEKDPQPRKHPNWDQSGDFTRNQASTYRVHVLQFSPGLLDSFYQKLIESDGRLKQLSQRRCPTLPHPYFSSNVYDAHGHVTCPHASLPSTTYQLGNHIQSLTSVQVMDNRLSPLHGVVNSQRLENPATLFTRLPDPHFFSYGYDANESLSNSYFPCIGYDTWGSQFCPHFPSNGYDARGSTSSYTRTHLQTTHQLGNQMQPSPPVPVMGDIIPEGIYRDPNLVVLSDFATSSRVGSTSPSDFSKALRDIMSSDSDKNSKSE